MKNLFLIKKSDSLTIKISKLLVYSYLLSMVCILPFNESWFTNFTLHSFDSPNFEFHQILTFSFIHLPIPTHLLMNIAFFVVFSSQLETLISKRDYYFMILINLIITFLLLNSVFKINPDECLAGSSGFVYTVIGSFLFLSKNNNLRFLSLVLVLDCLFELKTSDGNNFTLIGHFVGIVGGVVFTLYHKISNMIKLKKSE